MAPEVLPCDLGSCVCHPVGHVYKLLGTIRLVLLPRGSCRMAQAAVGSA